LSQPPSQNGAGIGVHDNKADATRHTFFTGPEDMGVRNQWPQQSGDLDPDCSGTVRRSPICRLLDDRGARIHRLKFTESEDQQLSALVEQFGDANWPVIAAPMPGRSVHQCRERWNHYLAPNTRTAEWTADEDRLLLGHIRVFGKQWSKLTQAFPGRPGIAIRNQCCKLVRQKNSDSILKAVLFDHREKIRLDLCDARNLPPPATEDDQSAPPSCLTLLIEALIAKDATHLYPITARTAQGAPIRPGRGFSAE
jgi:hypothetical protein